MKVVLLTILPRRKRLIVLLLSLSNIILLKDIITFLGPVFTEECAKLPSIYINEDLAAYSLAI